MPISVKVGGAWRNVGTVYVRQGGAWHQVPDLHARVGGAWKKVSATYGVGSGSVSHAFFGGAFAGISYESNGDIFGTVTTGSSDYGDWVDPKGLAPGSYQIRATYVSGNAPNSGDVLGTDLPLTSGRSWAQLQSGVGFRSGVILVELKDGAGNVLASGNITLSAQGL